MGVVAGVLGGLGLMKASQLYDQNQQSEQVRGLMGSANQPYLLDAEQQFQPGEQIPGLEVAGSGLLGGAGPFDPANQAQFSGGLMSIPGMQRIGATMLTDTQDRYQQVKQQNAASLAGQLAAREKDDFAEMQRLENFGFKGQEQLNSAVNSWQTTYNKQIGPLRDSLYKYQNVLARVNEAGGDLSKMTGADDLLMSRAFIKIMNGGREAFMKDDQQATMMAMQGFGTYDQLLNMLQGTGTLDADGRAKMLDVTNTMALQVQGALEGERALMQRKMDYFNVPRDLVMQEPMDKILRQEFTGRGTTRQQQITQRKRRASQRNFNQALPPPPQGVTWAYSGKVIRD